MLLAGYKKRKGGFMERKIWCCFFLLFFYMGMCVCVPVSTYNIPTRYITFSWTAVDERVFCKERERDSKEILFWNGWLFLSLSMNFCFFYFCLTATLKLIYPCHHHHLQSWGGFFSPTNLKAWQYGRCGKRIWTG